MPPLRSSSRPRRPRSLHSTRFALVVGVAMAVSTIACSGKRAERSARAAVPAVSFLVSAGDSTFWVDGVGPRQSVLRSPMLLTEHGGRFFELYLADDDRSYYDAVIVGQRIFRRDLASGDSLLLYEDTTIARIAAEYAASHPNEAPLGPEDDAAEAPSINATTQTELLDAAGPYLTFELHADLDLAGDRDQHVTRRGVIDVRDGHAVSVADLVGVRQAEEILRQAQHMLAATVDSIRRARDERARRAASALSGFVFDSMSFALVEDEQSSPSIAFVVPGRGSRAGGYSLPLPPIRIAEGPWWAPIRAGLPTTPSGAATWRGEAYDVVAREDSTGETAELSVRSGPNEVIVARVPTPVRRVLRLDAPHVDAATLDGLKRAFRESELYSGDVQTAARNDTPSARASSARAFVRVTPGRRYQSSARETRVASPRGGTGDVPMLRLAGRKYPLLPTRHSAFLHAGSRTLASSFTRRAAFPHTRAIGGVPPECSPGGTFCTCRPRRTWSPR